MPLTRQYAVGCDVPGCTEALQLPATTRPDAASDAERYGYACHADRWYCPAHWEQRMELQRQIAALSGTGTAADADAEA